MDVCLLCLQVEISVTSWSLVQRSLTECGVSECDSEASIMRKPWPTGGCRAIKKTANHTTPIYSHILPTHTSFKWTNLNNLFRAIHVGFVVENGALAQVSLPVFRLSLVIVVPLMPGTNTYSVFTVVFLNFLISQVRILWCDIRIYHGNFYEDSVFQ
jgi:hypothetical protein